MNGTRYDLAAIRDRNAMPDVAADLGLTLRRAGGGFATHCPFHEERTPSFSISLRSGVWRAKCYGCGWSGDVIDLYEGLRGTDKKTAIAALAGRCGLGPVMAEVGGRRPEVARKAPSAEEWTKPWVAPLSVPTRAELESLAALRGLQVPGLEAAAAAGLLRMADWPWRWDAESRKRGLGADAARSWVVTDASGWVAQYRRLDGGTYRIGNDADGWRESKSWSTKNVAWPVGAQGIGTRTRVVLVEGGADLLACHHFLWGLGMLGQVAVCCVLGASNRLAPRAMGHFRDREVRIIMDADPPKDGRATGMEAAARWQEQLSNAGAVVTVASLYGLTRCDGRPVKDVNDLAYADAATQAEAMPIFLEWGM